jgi:glycosyltransferase involved in cell wall biosynthesis
VLVPPGNPKALAAALLQVHSNPQFRKTLANEARKRVEEEFLTDRVIDRLCEIYVSLGVRCATGLVSG